MQVSPLFLPSSAALEMISYVCVCVCVYNLITFERVIHVSLSKVYNNNNWGKVKSVITWY